MHEISIYLISLTARLKSWWYYCYRGLESVSPSHACLDDKGQKQLKITELHLLCPSDQSLPEVGVGFGKLQEMNDKDSPIWKALGEGDFNADMHFDYC